MGHFYKVLLLKFLILIPCLSFSQGEGFKPSGQPYGRLFFNFHNAVSKGDVETAFEVTRAYFGYSYKMTEHFSANVKLDIGSPGDLSQFSLIRRYAYFKNACLTYEKNKLRLNMGLIDLRQFKVQERFWDRRYLYKSMMDEHRFGSSADIGVQVMYELNNRLDLDFTFMNGEGYKQLQSDNTFKSGLGISYFIWKSLLLRLYYDLEVKNVWQSTYSLFLGYSYKEKASLGIEYNLKEHVNYVSGQYQYGLSVYGMYSVFDKWELFARYDKLNSNILKNEERPWNLSSDGSAIIAGVQYAPIEQVKFALNYQDWFPYAGNLNNEQFIYINCEVNLN